MNNTHLKTLCPLMGILFISTCIAAADLGKGLANESDSILLKNQNNNYSHWNGVGKIFWGDDPACTSSLLDTRDKNNNAVGPAYLLTAAHCAFNASELQAVEPFEQVVKFNYFNDTPHAYKSYKINTTVWKDYQHTDLAIVTLDAALATVLKDGVTPLKLASAWPKVSADVLIVGAPDELPESGLRLAACSQQPTGAALVEGDRSYLDTLKNRCRDIRTGSSGSPVLDRQSGHILSVMATSTHGATIDQQCFDDAPCEVKNGQPEWSSDTHYSNPVDYLSSCFSEGVFTSASNACTLHRTFQVTDTTWPTQYVAMPENETSPDPVLQATFSLSTPYYRFKTARDVTQCSSAHNYSAPIDASNAFINAPISREPGMYFLCIIGVESADHRPSIELMKSAWVTPAQLIGRAPVRMPEPTITLSADWNYQVKWRYSVPQYFGTFYYTGPPHETDCHKIPIEDYAKTFEPITFEAEQLPLTLCSRNNDLSDRYSDVRSDLLALP
ncbi:V8-like Glu-specific endopeptidase [Pseudomonas lini]|uniref:trypsin-like serine peptidase n=1 Tax=Pseudomonas lini TaxID=163011 RepID=UPI0027874D0F|nr:serine protease [Pseudomonas lini]MDQ0122312.1 V8-like Glu-specific endopeptidase [Pseudomonas lini]